MLSRFSWYVFHFAQNLFISFCSFLTLRELCTWCLLITFFLFIDYTLYTKRVHSFLLNFYSAQNMFISSCWFMTLRRLRTFCFVDYLFLFVDLTLSSKRVYFFSLNIYFAQNMFIFSCCFPTLRTLCTFCFWFLTLRKTYLFLLVNLLSVFTN